MLETKKLNLKFETYLFKEKKLWIFFVIQAILWFVFYFWQIRPIVDIVLSKGNLVSTDLTHILSSLILVGLFFSCQILSILLLPRIKFLWVVLILLSCYLKNFGLFFSVVWWVIRVSNVKKRWQKFIVGFLSSAILMSLMTSIQILVMFIFYFILEKTTIPVL